MRRDPERSKKLAGRNPLKNTNGQILLESLLLAVFLTAFFGLLIAFTDQTQHRLQKSQWTKKAKS